MMKVNFAVFLFLAAVSCLTSCAGEILTEESAAPRGRGTVRASRPADFDVPVSLDVSDMEKIAEIERAGIYFPGLALAESGLREKAGDFTGAAVAAYKELSWAFSYGTISREQVEEGLQNVLAFAGENFHILDSDRNSAIAALRGCMAFAREDWDLAEELLSGILPEEDEPDSFLRWMILVCALEKGSSERSAYGAIRARYTPFPEYWYRGARAFSSGNAAGNNQVAAAFAEQCINSSPAGPYAGDCRKILEEFFGLSHNGRANSGILTRAEIEDVIRSSVSGNDPLVLEELFPLMALPENPYTLYAVGALKALSQLPIFRSFFADEALKSPGRLGERLNYIARS